VAGTVRYVLAGCVTVRYGAVRQSGWGVVRYGRVSSGEVRYGMVS
jgi:hypothetical protein